MKISEEEPPFNLTLVHAQHNFSSYWENSIESVLAMGRSAINLILSNITK